MLHTLKFSGLKPIYKHCHLQYAHLDSWCPAGLSYLAAGLPQLLELDINGCNSITNVGLAAIARGLPLLRQLSLAAVHSHITDVGIRPLQQLHHLEGLQLSSCYNLTDRYAPKTGDLLKHLYGLSCGLLSSYLACAMQFAVRASSMTCHKWTAGWCRLML